MSKKIAATIVVLAVMVLARVCAYILWPERNPEPGVVQYTVPTITETAYEPHEYSEGMVGWLQVDGLDIDDPVMQAEDNDYYLRRNEQGESSVWGCYFASYVCDMTSKENLSRVTVIFGHSNGKSWSGKFAALKNFKDADFASEHGLITMEVAGEPTYWQVFAAGEYPVEQQYLNPEPDDEYFIDEIAQFRAHSHNEFQGVDVGINDKILILSTCTGDSYDMRYIVCAVQI